MVNEPTTRAPESKERLMDGVYPSEHIYRGVELAMQEGIQARGRELAVEVYRILDGLGIIDEVLETGAKLVPSTNGDFDERRVVVIPSEVWEEAGVRGVRRFGGGFRSNDTNLMEDLENLPNGNEVGVSSELERTVTLLRETMSMIDLLTHPQEHNRAHPDMLYEWVPKIRKMAIDRVERETSEWTGA